jgi:hypothetical protein
VFYQCTSNPTLAVDSRNQWLTTLTARQGSEGLAALVQIIGTLYSVRYAFATYGIWGQFTSVENEILKESGALKDLLLPSSRLREGVREPIVRP